MATTALQSFHPRHFPALFFAFANLAGLVVAPFRGTSTVMELYGFPPAVTQSPEAQAAWSAGHGRTVALGLAMQMFYFRGQYAACDVLLMGAAWLGVTDYWVLAEHGDKSWAWFRLLSSLAFAGAGFFGLTQGR